MPDVLLGWLYHVDIDGSPSYDRLAVIGIMSADPVEIAKPLFDKLQLHEVHNGIRRDFHCGSLDGRDVVLMSCGVGKVRAAARTQYLIDHFRISSIIFTGVAGALNPELAMGDIVVSKEVMEHDFCISGTPELDRSVAHKYQADSFLINLALAAGERLGLGEKMRVGTVLTGDQVVAEKTRKQALWEMYCGDCVEMEGAAVGMVCWMNEVPFVLIRAISDRADESILKDHPIWLGEAIERASAVVLEMIGDLLEDVK